MGGVIWATWALQATVIPAKLVLRGGGGAGIHSANLWKCAIDRMDSRFRAND